MHNLFQRVVLGHQSPDHFGQRYGDLGQTLGEGCQQPSGLLEPLLFPGVVGEAQEIGRRHWIGAGFGSILVCVTHKRREMHNGLTWHLLVSHAHPTEHRSMMSHFSSSSIWLQTPFLKWNLLLPWFCWCSQILLSWSFYSFFSRFSRCWVLHVAKWFLFLSNVQLGVCNFKNDTNALWPAQPARHSLTQLRLKLHLLGILRREGKRKRERETELLLGYIWNMLRCVRWNHKNSLEWTRSAPAAMTQGKQDTFPVESSRKAGRKQ